MPDALTPAPAAPSGTYIVYLSDVARLTGSTDAALFASFVWGWQQHPDAQAREGWLWATQEQITAATGLTRSQQETARARLRSSGLLEERHRGLPCRLWFRLTERIAAVVAAFQARTAAASAARGADRKGGRPRRPLLSFAPFAASLRESRTQGRGQGAGQPAEGPQAIASPTASATPTATSSSPSAGGEAGERLVGAGAGDDAPALRADQEERDDQDEAAPDTLREMIEIGVSAGRARHLYAAKGEAACRQQIAYLPFRPIRTTRGAVLAESIAGGWGEPKGYHAAERAAQDARQRAEREEAARRSAAAQQAALDAEEQRVAAYLGALDAAKRAALERQAVEAVRAKFPHTRSRLDAQKIGDGIAALIRSALRDLVLAQAPPTPAVT